jgi:formylglycine-generating enzyme required for sulfatase activity/serine/threonine protein kinase
MAQADDPYATIPPSKDGAPANKDYEVLAVGGGYRLLQPLGSGAFGTVWKAEAPGGVEVAVKLIPRALKPDEAQRELNALQLMKRLRHHNLLVLQAFFALPDRLIIILELADGSLRGRLQQCQDRGLAGIPPVELLRYFREAAEALDYLHGQNVQHRDVKPDNLLLLGSHVKVADFGLARLLEQNQLESATNVGTPACMAPEVWNNKLSVHSDQYSLAVTYAHLRTGRKPFAGDTLAALMKAHLLDAPNLEHMGPHEQEVLRRALAKRPDARYPSCTAFVRALVAAHVAEREDTEPASAPPVPTGAATLPSNLPAPLPPVSPAAAVSVTQPLRSRPPAAERPRLIVLVTLGVFVLFAGLVLAGLYLSRPRDRAPTAAKVADSAGASAPLPEPKRQPAGPGKPLTDPKVQSDIKDAAPAAVPSAALAREITNSIRMRLVLIPAGRFTMGSPPDEPDRHDTEVAHEVVLTRPIYMGVFEVTQAQYKEVMGTNPSWLSPFGGGKDLVRGQDTDAFPVEGMTWEEAVTFCERLSARSGEKRAGLTYRLPTEAEWEYACRGGTSSAFHYGNSLSSLQANFDGKFPYGGAAKGSYLERIARVGSYSPNRFGLYDMHGNVWELCSDWYDKDYYKVSPREDPQGPKTGLVRVCRGGSWNNHGYICRAAFRSTMAPTDRSGAVGFRAVAVPSRTP